MSRLKELRNERNQEILTAYNDLANKKVGRAKLYTNHAVCVMVGQKFYLSGGTIENIINSIKRNKK